MLRIHSWLVYEMRAAAAKRSAAVGRARGIFSVPITEPLLYDCFKDDPCRLRDLLHLQCTGAHGRLLLGRAGWITHGWISIDANSRPPHLPQHITESRPFWIHTCHVRSEYRGQGFYRDLLAELVQVACAKSSAPTVWIDTGVTNLPSRRGILGSGFEEHGVVRVLNLWLPKVLMLPLRGRWCATELHPPLSEGTPDGIH
jgi:GNAT superfamily N-acetyltransferase